MILCALKTMSEASDSFEELDLYDQSRLNGTPQTTILSINQTPSDLTNDYQRLEGESLAAVMTKSARQVEKLEYLEFELSWQARDVIISSLSQHTKLLHGHVIKPLVRKNM